MNRKIRRAMPATMKIQTFSSLVCSANMGTNMATIPWNWTLEDGWPGKVGHEAATGLFYIMLRKTRALKVFQFGRVSRSHYYSIRSNLDTLNPLAWFDHKSFGNYVNSTTVKLCHAGRA